MKKSKLTKKPLSKRTPYSKATDDEKVRRNWSKANGLFKRGEYSVSILRCGTCVELAVNFAIRQELVVDRDLLLPFVNKLLKSANGLRNKYQNIYLPIMEEWEEHEYLKQLWRSCIEKINRQRNAVAHSGEFKSRSIAKVVMEQTFKALKTIMDLYDHEIVLKPFKA